MAARRRSPLALAAAAAATAPLLALAQPSASQVWINWGYGPSEAVVSWSAPDASLSTNVTELWAQWAYDEASVAGGAGIETAYAALARYATPPGGKGIFGTLPGYVSSVFYRVTLAGVATARRVFVRVGSAAAGWSRVYSFTSHPGVGANVPVRLLVLADLEVDCYVEATGKVCNPSAVRAAVTTPARDWRGMDSINAGAVILGDLSYANGNQSHWDFWHSTFSEEVASKLAVMRCAESARACRERTLTRSSLTTAPCPPSHQPTCTAATRATMRRRRASAWTRSSPSRLAGAACPSTRPRTWPPARSSTRTRSAACTSLRSARTRT
jgi:hypothetical protein